MVPVLDNAAAIAAAIVELLSDDLIWTRQAQRQMDYAKSHFSRDVCRKAIAEAVEAAMANAKKRLGRLVQIDVGSAV